MKSAYWKNPILVKELRTRMRGYRVFILVTTHLLILGLVTFLAYILFESTLSPSSSLDDRRLFSKLIFGLLVVLEMIMVCFIAPALTSGAISNERERHTYDLLRVTMLSPKALVFGKLSSALVFIALLLLSSIPMLSPAFIIGGVLGVEVLISLVLLAAGAVAFCTIGLFLSSLIPRTLLSSILSYAWAAFLMFGIPVIALVTLIITQTTNTFRVEQIPYSTLYILLAIAWTMISFSPLASLITSEIILIEQQSIWWLELPVGSSASIGLLSPWILTLAVYSLLVVILIWIAIQRVKQVDN